MFGKRKEPTDGSCSSTQATGDNNVEIVGNTVETVDSAVVDTVDSTMDIVDSTVDRTVHYIAISPP